MSRRASVYKSAKRKKELLRQKKKEEKRQKRLKKNAEQEQPATELEQEVAEHAEGEDTSQES
ncbi:MAG: hypothetical protein JSV13_10710 [Nitrospiraceae bacterium]|nr:MAG: hypothetical protein JSV13_10710 [Nitrospiraceae bacterium]